MIKSRPLVALVTPGLPGKDVDQTDRVTKRKKPHGQWRMRSGGKNASVGGCVTAEDIAPAPGPGTRLSRADISYSDRMYHNYHYYET